MKILKSLVLITGLAIITVNISAQATTGTSAGGKQQMDPQQRAQQMTDQIKKDVSGITPDQESKILAAEQTFTQGMKDAWTSSNGDHDAVKSKMQPLKDARDAQIKTILTADQYTQYQKMEAAHKGGGHTSGN